jgi:hypothetical protein
VNHQSCANGEDCVEFFLKKWHRKSAKTGILLEETNDCEGDSWALGPRYVDPFYERLPHCFPFCLVSLHMGADENGVYSEIPTFMENVTIKHRIFGLSDFQTNISCPKHSISQLKPFLAYPLSAPFFVFRLCPDDWNIKLDAKRICIRICSITDDSEKKITSCYWILPVYGNEICLNINSYFRDV